MSKALICPLVPAILAGPPQFRLIQFVVIVIFGLLQPLGVGLSQAPLPLSTDRWRLATLLANWE